MVRRLLTVTAIGLCWAAPAAVSSVESRAEAEIQRIAAESARKEAARRRDRAASSVQSNGTQQRRWEGGIEQARRDKLERALLPGTRTLAVVVGSVWLVLMVRSRRSVKSG